MESNSSRPRGERAAPNPYLLLEPEVWALQTLSSSPESPLDDFDSIYYQAILNIVGPRKLFEALSNLDDSQRLDFLSLLKDYLKHLKNPPPKVYSDPLFSLPEISFDMMDLSPEHKEALNAKASFPPIIGVNGVSCSGKDASMDLAKEWLDQEGYNVVIIRCSECILNQVEQDLKDYGRNSQEYKLAKEVEYGCSQGHPVDPSYTVRAIREQVLSSISKNQIDGKEMVVVLTGGPRYGDHLAGFYPGFLHTADKSLSPAITSMVITEGTSELSFKDRLPLDAVVSLILYWEQAISRMIDRVVSTVKDKGWAGLRSDDLNPDAYNTRWRVYGENTRPMLTLLEHFIGIEAYRIDANHELEQVARKVKEYIQFIMASHRREIL